MGYNGKFALKEKAIELRKEGNSIRTIEKKLKISRSSASLWTRDVRLTNKQLKKLYKNKKSGGLKGSVIAAANKKQKRINLTNEIYVKAMEDVGTLTSREAFLVGVVLYFCEGDKADKNVAFTNSDPKALIFFIQWLRMYCHVDNGRIRVNIFLHENLDEKKAKQFWKSKLQIQDSHFKKTYVVKNKKKVYRKSKYINGICRITVSDVNLHRKIMGWISGVFNL